MAKQNHSASTNNNAQIQLKAADKASLTIPASQHLEQATKAAEGTISIKQSMGALKLVDVADVDLLLTFANGEHVVIPHGAIDAVGKNPPDALFSDTKISLPELLKLVGVTNPAKAGSLRLVSENIDANPPTDENLSRDEHIPDTPPPPAPMLKVGAGQGTGKSLGTGLGNVLETYTPLVTAQPSVYRVGKSSAATLSDIVKGNPNMEIALYTSNEFKVSPSGTNDLPQGAYSASAQAAELASRASPALQATREVINGTSGNDTISFNSNFSSDPNQWSKTLHANINNFTSIDSITFTLTGANANLLINTYKLNLVGTGISKTGDYTWSLTPPANPSAGFDINIVYDIYNGISPIDFNIDALVIGKSGPISLDYTKNLYFTYRDVDANQTEFTVSDSKTGVQMMVLPSGGLGVKFQAGAGDDTIDAGAGNDWIFGDSGNDILNGNAGNDILYGGTGADILNGGNGSDTASYKDAAAVSGSTGITASLKNSLVNTGEASGDTYSEIENLTGSAFNDTLIGNSYRNVLSGLSGDDMLIGINMGNTLDGGDGNDTASYQEESDNIIASLKTNLAYKEGASTNADKLISIENLTGGAGNDTLEGNGDVTGNKLDGGLGNDTVTFANSTTGVFASLSNNSQATGDAAGDTYISIENLTGGAGNDTLEGKDDANKFDGGLGNDTVTYINAPATNGSTGIFASLIAPTNNTGYAAGDLYTSIENLTGSAFNDTLEGNAGANKFDGGLGNDTVTYANTISNTSVGVAASLTQGLTAFDATLDAIGDSFVSIENLTGSNYDDNLIGNDESNTLKGGAGNDTLEGMNAADILDGGAGNNTASYQHSLAGVTASLATTALNLGDAYGDTYINIQNLRGSEYADTLYDDTGTNALFGGGGNDLIYTDMKGASITDGGMGDDIIYLTNFDSTVDIISGGGHDASGDTLVLQLASGVNQFKIDLYNGWFGDVWGNKYANLYSIQNYTDSSISFVGDPQSRNFNTIVASNENNTIIGSSISWDSRNTVDYQYANGAISANLSATGINVTGGSGNDSLQNIQNIYATKWDDTLKGNERANTFQGGAGADDIDGSAGIDTSYYGDSTSGVYVNLNLTTQSSTFYNSPTSNGFASGDKLTNIENITGSNYADRLEAKNDGSANVISGGNGNDTIVGYDRDMLYGQNDNDTFILDINSLSAIFTGDAGTDTLIVNNISSTNASTLFSTLAGRSFSNEAVNIQDGRANTFNISSSDISLIVDGGTSNKLTIYADSGDVINLTGSNTTFNNINGLNQLTNLSSNQEYVIYSNGVTTGCSIIWQHA